MRAGDLDRRIEIQAKTPTQASNGELEDAWSTVATVWAEVRELYGRELFRAQQLDAEIDTRFRIRYRSGLDPATHQVAYGGLTYDIKAVTEGKGRHAETLIFATAKTPEPSDG